MAAADRDDADPLSGLRPRYKLPTGLIRLDGSSGGAFPRTTPARLRKFVEHRWDPNTARPRIDHDTRGEARRAAAGVASLIGAVADEITVAESSSMNLFKTVLAATRLRARPIVVIEHDCFTIDHLVARSAADFAGVELRLLHDLDELPSILDERVAVVALSHSDPSSGGLRDLSAITAEVHRHGALTLWDLAHTAGAVRIDLRDAGADFAIGCGDRYLGGGSGAPGYCFIAERHHTELASTLSQESVCGPLMLNPLAKGFLGAPSTLSTAGLRSGVSILDGVPVGALEAKTTGLAELFRSRLRQADLPVDIVEPPDGTIWGTQLILRHQHAQRLAQELLAQGVLVESIEPDSLRLNFGPAWLRYLDVWEAADLLQASFHEILHHS
ncbi:aminotransferase class V-fold PLP-dependent enzyme [Parasphingorhabdus pacifica]